MSAVLEVLLAPRCAGCDAAGAWLCLACREACDPVRRGRLHAATVYGGAIARAVHRFKYRGERALAAELGTLVAGCVARDLARGIPLDVVVPAVLHRERTRDRGYDQAWLLAAEVARQTGLPLRAPLRRVRPSRPQIELDRAARATDMRGAFIAEAGALRGMRVALVDDVPTTGATLSAASAPLTSDAPRPASAFIHTLRR